MKKEHLSFDGLILEMYKITKGFAFYVQRDTMLDIAELYKIYAICPSDGFMREWGINESGTNLDDSVTGESILKFKIAYTALEISNPFGEWSIETI